MRNILSFKTRLIHLKKKEKGLYTKSFVVSFKNTKSLAVLSVTFNPMWFVLYVSS